MTWVAVVKFWAYQSYQLQLIVYTNLTLMLHGLELFSSGIRQWVDVPMGSQYSVPIPWPLTAELMSVVAVHGGDDNYYMWPSYNGKTLHSTARNINGYVIGIFQ